MVTRPDECSAPLPGGSRETRTDRSTQGERGRRPGAARDEASLSLLCSLWSAPVCSGMASGGAAADPPAPASCLAAQIPFVDVPGDQRPGGPLPLHVHQPV